ncbi:uncharacterized protein LOC131252852 isoform X2 [Magnolia sinica]|uniref:uncharacterized protein LOC131252852 isoform X2 n=1 Tax=Magnolia sinica TaxID=86752 RepID=UPI00265B6444|nr:uncharacterized protein LOC131252852 isoform X2 [Magnolia sinica]
MSLLLIAFKIRRSKSALRRRQQNPSTRQDPKLGKIYYLTMSTTKETDMQVPSSIVGESEIEASKEGRSLSDFKYVCVGYSVFLDAKDNPNEQQENQAELPFCVGIELLLDKRVSNADHVPAHAHNKEDGHVFHQPRSYKPTHSMGEEFLSRFTRNAGLVASGVARNIHKVGNHIKDSLDDILYPYRRRPK